MNIDGQANGVEGGTTEREREEKRGNQPESVTMINDMYLVERQ